MVFQDDTNLHQHSNVNPDGTEKSGLLPTVFKWEGGGKDVAISGTFSNWKPVPMVKRFVVVFLSCKVYSLWFILTNVTAMEILSPSLIFRKVSMNSSFVSMESGNMILQW